VKVLKSTGHGILDQAAIAALRQWRFRVHRGDLVRIPIRFTMSGVRHRMSGAVISDSLAAVKDWEIIVNNLSKAGWSVGSVSAINSEGRTVWIVDAHGNGKRFIVRAEEMLTAFV
jgi:hypothetical protein